MKNRFYVDKRIGCVAVRDRTMTEECPTPGLHCDTVGVIAYWHGVRDEHTRTRDWTICDTDIESAYRTCKLLNELNERVPE